MEIKYSELTSMNFSTFLWNNQEAISVKGQVEVTPRHLLQCQHTLIAVQFQGETSIRSLKAFLRTCPNLQHLTFVDTLLDEYRRYSEDKLIEHPTITHVAIKSSTKIAKKEHWLVDFLVWRVKFNNLLSLRVQKIYRTLIGSDSIVETNDFMEKLGPQVDSNIFTQFILRNADTLRELEVGGGGILVHDLLCPEERLLESQKISLDNFIFSLDAEALPAFLKSQRKLSVLKTSHIFSLSPSRCLSIIPLMSSVIQCIQNNYRTLTTVILYPVIIIDLPRATLFQEKLLQNFAIDCTVFSNCTSLQTLRVGLHTYRTAEDLAALESATLMGTRLTNLHVLPTHLTELYVPLEEYSHDELEILGNNFEKFANLRLFYFGTSQLNPLNSFMIRLPWLETLLFLPQIQSVDFHNGRLEEPEATFKLVVMKPNGRNVVFNDNWPRFSFQFAE